MADCVVALALWAHMPWPCTVGLGLLGLMALARRLSPPAHWHGFWQWGTATAWGCGVVVPACALLMSGDWFRVQYYADYYYAVLAWLVAATLVPASCNAPEGRHRAHWRGMVSLWAFWGAGLWLAAAYVEDNRAAFCLGLLLAGGLLMALKQWFRLPVPAVLVVNTLILLILGLPLVDLALHPSDFMRVGSKDANPAMLERYYDYQASRRERRLYEQWWDYYWEQTIELDQKLVARNRGSPVSVRLRPNARTTFVRCPISINSRGFRGREIPEAKGEAYRIVAMGESTTFGFTINPEDKPWPELLEQLIRERLKPIRPVEVINAGVVGADILDNLHRLAKEILPLKPDMIICYHGVNGFPLLLDVRRARSAQAVPQYRRRPLQLLADCEYRAKVIWFNHHHASHVPFRPPDLANLLESAYAQAYRDLINVAHTNRIRLVLATFPLAVNTNSPPELLEFFRPRHPLLDFYIRANVAHGLLVRELARQYPDVRLVDTRPHLDGEAEKYLDVMHLTQEGDRQLAETFFAGIRALLEQDLAPAKALRAAPP